METLTRIVQYTYLNCTRRRTEIITSMTNRERAMDLILVLFLLVIDHENVIGCLVFARKNQRYCEFMEN